MAEGQEVPVIVTRVYEDTGDIELSISQALQQQDWLRAKELLESKEVVDVEVIGYNRGGLMVHFGQIRGFVPLSHVADMPRNIPPEERMRHMAAMVGKVIPVCVIEVDRGRRRLILSHRQGVEKRREKRREELLATLEEGQTVTGRVRSFAKFGVFVDLGGVDGLIHQTELSWDPVEDPRQLLEIGQEIEVKVIKVDREKRRIGLSLKRMHTDPWEERVAHYTVGDIVPAVITNVAPFGAFARLESGLEGLIHVSELGLASGQKPEDKVQAGDLVNVRILDIDHERQRISLSMRGVPQWEVAEEEAPEPEAAPPPPSQVQAEQAAAAPENEVETSSPAQAGREPGASPAREEDATIPTDGGRPADEPEDDEVVRAKGG